jgi:energy-coupling factor transport system ATP-binding protein
MSGQAVITVEEVSYRYPGQRGGIAGFSLEAGPGEMHLVCGPSGCGKSTLARILSGLIPHLYRGRLTGRVLIGGRASHATPLWQLTEAVGLVMQNPAAQLLASTVKDEVIFGLENLGLSPSQIEARLAAALEGFGLEGLAGRDPRTLSGGEQQRLILAAVMARQPLALILDEPLSMLDTTSAQAVVGHLERLSGTGCAVVAFEHRRAWFDRLAGLERHELTGPAAAEDAGALPELPQHLPAFRLSVDGLGVEIGKRPILESIDLDLAGGQVVALVGANGSGKTTLLRALAGLQPHTGRITGFSTGSRGKPRLGLAFQNPDRQIFNATVRQEVLFGLPDYDVRLYRGVLALLGLGPYEETPPLLLSEGEKKRLALATVLMRPGLSGICLDEPTLGQDEGHRRLLGLVLHRLASAGYLCLVATHDLGWALQWADRLLMLREGRLAACGEPRAVFERRDLWAQAGLLLPPWVTQPCDAGQHSL